MKNFLKKLLKRSGIVALGIAFVIGGLWLYLFVRSHQIYSLPQPTGNYHVGHRLYDWTDEKRTNVFVDKSQEKRELMADVWYPTEQTNGTAAPYLPAAWQKAADEDQGGGALFKHPFSKIKTNGFEQGSIAAGKFPVVIFQPGFGRVAADYTSFAENMASNGYVVIASSPTYISDVIVLSDGRVIKASPKAALPENVSGAAPAMQQASAALLETWAGDDSFLIDQATTLNSDQRSNFYGKFDLEHVGVMGHSLGGAAAYQVCKTDARCKVALDMDGTLFGDTKPSRVPFMYLSSDHSQDQGDAKQEADYNDTLLARQSQRTYHVSIAQTAHFNFSDLALYSYKPVMRLFGVVGAIDGKKAIELSNIYINDMLNHYLRSMSAPHLNNDRPPKGVTIKTYN